jgi:hypothetical protein
VGVEMKGGAKVNDLNARDVTVLNEDVLWFEITVTDVVCMAVGNGGKDLKENHCCV